MTTATGMYEWLVFLHVRAAMVWLGGITVLGAFAVRVLHEREGDAVGRFLGSLRRIGPLVLAPAPVTAAIGAERAAARGDHDEALRRLRRWAWGMALIVVLLVVATWAMVFKPGL